MGKRSRARATGGAADNTAGEETQKAKRPAGARVRLDPVRRTLTAYVAAALVLAVLTLVGIVVLGGRLGPFITLAVVVVAAGLVFRAATARLVDATLGDEDRMMQTMAGGMLVLCVVLAAAGAVVSTLA